MGNNGESNAEKGTAFEDLICYVFGKVSGISITQRDVLNVFSSEEIDIALWNEQKPNGLPFLPNILLVECKNWSQPVSSGEVSWFGRKLESRGKDYGILIANMGITGNAQDLSSAHSIISSHLEKKRHIIVITREDIKSLDKTDDLILLIKEKLCLLSATGSSLTK